MLATFPIAMPAGAGDSHPAEILNIWPGQPPGAEARLAPEGDLTKSTDRQVGGERVLRLGNVAAPQIAVYRPPPERATGTTVVICPGGGFSVLAYDLEGTEVAAWLNSLGITAIVLKYRVPFRDPQRRWLAAVQDVQRAMSLVRSRAAEWKIDPRRIGMLGFSAGAVAALRVALAPDQRWYAAADRVDTVSFRPDFAVLVYTANILTADRSRLEGDWVVAADTPPLFFVHAFDDSSPVESAMHLGMAVKAAGISVELHLYDAGGHGYGLRRVAEFPVTSWPDRAREWFTRRGLIASASVNKSTVP